MYSIDLYDKTLDLWRAVADSTESSSIEELEKIHALAVYIAEKTKGLVENKREAKMKNDARIAIEIAAAEFERTMKLDLALTKAGFVQVETRHCDTKYEVPSSRLDEFVSIVASVYGERNAEKIASRWIKPWYNSSVCS